MTLYEILFNSGWKDDATTKSIILQVEKWMNTHFDQETIVKLKEKLQ